MTESKHIEIKVITCSSVTEAESLYFKYRSEGWRISKPLKLVWSWKHFKYMARFEMKNTGCDIEDYIKGVSSVVAKGYEAYKSIQGLNKARRLRILKDKINNN